MDGFDVMPAGFSPLERGDAGVRSFARNQVGNATIVTTDDRKVQIYVTRSAPGSDLFCLCVMLDQAAPVLLASGGCDDMLLLRDATLEHFLPHFSAADGPTKINTMTPIQRIRCDRGMQLVLRRLAAADPQRGAGRRDRVSPIDSPAARRLAAAAIAQAKAPAAPPIRVKADGLALPDGEADPDPIPIETVMAQHPHLRHAVPAPDIGPPRDPSANVPGHLLRVKIGIDTRRPENAQSFEAAGRQLRRRHRLRQIFAGLAACGFLLIGGGIYYGASHLIPHGTVSTPAAAKTASAATPAADSTLVASLAATAGVARQPQPALADPAPSPAPPARLDKSRLALAGHGPFGVADVPVAAFWSPGHSVQLLPPGGGTARTPQDFAKLGLDLPGGA